MKTPIFFLFFLMILSCQKTVPQKDYHDFTYEFRDKSKESHRGEEIANWIKDGKKINLEFYNKIIKDSTISLTNIGKDILSLGRFVGVTAYSNFDLFLIKKDSQFIFIVGNKEKKSITDFFTAPKNMPIQSVKLQRSSVNGRRVLITFSKVEEKFWSGFSKKTNHFYNIHYTINTKGKIVFAEKELNQFDTFNSLPEKNKFSGTYKVKTDNQEIELIVKDSTLEGKHPFYLRISDKTSSCSLMRYDNKNIINNRAAVIWKKNELYKLNFENNQVNFYYNECDHEDCQNAFCNVKAILSKE